MQKFPTYVINLEHSIERKVYMEGILSSFPYMDVHFVKAVDGRHMEAETFSECFDQNRAFKRYGRVLRPGEAGCTMSHRKCLQEFIASDAQYSLICEDDLFFQDNDLEPVFEKLGELLCSDKPRLVILSGDYWYRALKPLSGKYRLARVREAICSQAYFINRAAAERVLTLGPTYLADDWYAMFRTGVTLYATFPHVADQNRLDFQTEISPAYTGYIKRNLSLKTTVVYYYRAVYKKVLKALGRFEKKNFKW